jgi:ferredoxin
VGDVNGADSSPWVPERKPSSGKTVAIIGGGPAGLSAAYYLAGLGHACTLLDRRAEAGGMLRDGVDRARLPMEVVDREVDLVRRMGVRFELNATVDRARFEQLRTSFGAVIVATGDIKNDGGDLGLPRGKQGIEAAAGTFAGKLPGVFVIGSAVRPSRLAVRAVADGKAVAAVVNQYLAGQALSAPGRPFMSRLGALREGELDRYLAGTETAGRTDPSGGPAGGYAGPEAAQQSARCLHCDCRKPGACELRRLAGEWGAKQEIHAGAARNPAGEVLQGRGVFFEQGKCIRCGICVQVCRQKGENAGLTFKGRGFDVRVVLPFGRTLDQVPADVLAACVQNCPTGALAFESEP